jgi:hypothetical protein
MRSLQRMAATLPKSIGEVLPKTKQKATMTLKTMIVTFIIGLSATVAQGVELHTGYIERDSDAQGVALVCGATNVGKQAAKARIELLDFFGTVVAVSTPTIGPGNTRTRSTGVNAGDPEAAGCRFDLQGGQTQWRANGCIFDNTKRVCISTIEAR